MSETGRDPPLTGLLLCGEKTGGELGHSRAQCQAKVRAMKKPWQMGLPKGQRPAGGV